MVFVGSGSRSLGLQYLVDGDELALLLVFPVQLLDGPPKALSAPLGAAQELLPEGLLFLLVLDRFLLGYLVQNVEQRCRSLLFQTI